MPKEKTASLSPDTKPQLKTGEKAGTTLHNSKTPPLRRAGHEAISWSVLPFPRSPSAQKQIVIRSISEKTDNPALASQIAQQNRSAAESIIPDIKTTQEISRIALGQTKAALALP